MKGKEMTEAQAEKMKKQHSYKLTVDEAIDSLNLFLKHYKPEKQESFQSTGRVDTEPSEEETKTQETPTLTKSFNDAGKLLLAAYKLGQPTFEFQVRATGLESQLPISADDFKLLRLFHMFAFENVTLAMTFGDQLDKQQSMVQKLIERSEESVFPPNVAPRDLAFKELAGLYDKMLGSEQILQLPVMGQLPMGMPIMHMPFIQGFPQQTAVI